MSSSRSPARWLGPLAILAALVAIFAIVGATTGDDGSSSSPSPASSEQERAGKDGKGGEATTSTQRTATTAAPATKRKTYEVRPGDTLGSIAESTGVAIAELQELNPGIDASSLSIGQEIRLAR